MENNPLVSIIVPVYKAQKTLARCVESMLAQTYTNWELLLIDDGSPDESGVLCDEWSKKDPRIRSFHKPNGGVSSARNYGLEELKGDWILCVDSDDWLDADYIEKFFFDGYDKYDLIFGFQIFEENSGLRMPNMECAPRYADNIVDSIMTMEQSVGFNFGVVTNKIFRSKAIKENQITFPEGIQRQEDTIFAYKHYKYVGPHAFVQNCGYHADRFVDGTIHLTSRPLPIDVVWRQQHLFESAAFDLSEDKKWRNYTSAKVFTSLDAAIIQQVFGSRNQKQNKWSVYLTEMLERLKCLSGDRSSSFNFKFYSRIYAHSSILYVSFKSLGLRPNVVSKVIVKGIFGVKSMAELKKKLLKGS